MAERVALLPVAACDAGGGDCAPAQRDRPVAVASWHGKLPLLFPRRESLYGQITAGVDQGRAYAARAQLCQGGIDGHPLRDTAEIELDASRERHAAADGIHPDAAPSTARLTWNKGIRTIGREIVEGAVVTELHELVEHGW